VLADRRTIIFLDDAQNAAQVTDLMPPKGSTLLVTSRYRFVLPGCNTRLLRVMSPPEAEEMVCTIAPRTGETAAEVALLCGYLPLALRAAASLLAVTVDLPPAEYVAQLRDERRRLERIGREGIDIGLEASFALSYLRLDPAVARVLDTLTAFDGSFDARAAEAVAEDEGHHHLSELVRRGLVEWDPESDRYRLHELIRLFAETQLSPDQQDFYPLAHASYYARVLQSAQVLLKQGHDSVVKALRLFDLEWANIRRGQEWAASRTRADRLAARICDACAGCVQIVLFRRPSTAKEWLEAGIEAARQLGDLRSQMVHLNNLAAAYSGEGRLDDSIAPLEVALATAEQLGDRGFIALCLGNLSARLLDVGNASRAIPMLTRQLAIVDDMNDTEGKAFALGRMASAAALLGDLPKAIELCRQSADLFRSTGDVINECRELGNLSVHLLSVRDYVAAASTLEQALALNAPLGGTYERVRLLLHLGDVYRMQRNSGRAVQCYEEAFASSRDVEDASLRSAAGIILAEACLDQQRPRRAVGLCEQVLQDPRLQEDRWSKLRLLHAAVRGHRALGDAQAAKRYDDEWTALYGTMADDIAVLGAFIGSAPPLEVEREVRRFMDFLEPLGKRCRMAGDRILAFRALFDLGTCRAVVGEYPQAREALEEARSVACQIGSQLDEGRALHVLGVISLAEGEWQRATGYLEQALAVARSADERVLECAALVDAARVHAIQSHWSQAEEVAGAALLLAHELGSRRNEGSALMVLSGVAGEQGNHQEALRLAREAADTLAQIGGPQLERVRAAVALWHAKAQPSSPAGPPDQRDGSEPPG
jgi:tetratricopeptide (TPR) repeat protein